jgi:oligopeptide/dipeptide ABC transporter ATP-binding protein
MVNLLQADNLTVSYKTAEGEHKVLDRVSFFVGQGESVGLVGESGSGKTTLGLSILKLLPSNAVYNTGSIVYNGKNLLAMDETSLRHIRGKAISIVFQDPLASLDPLFTVGYQISEAVQAHHTDIEKAELEKIIVSIMGAVGLPEPFRTKQLYPHELSGGMRQRVMIAIALVNNPSLLIADEPTTALDVTIQAQIIDLLKRAKDHYNLTILLITHDLGVAYELVDRLIIMYGGVIVEQGTKQEIFSKPYHPYTKALLMAIPELMEVALHTPSRLSAIPGSVRAHYDNYVGCRFYDRCTYRTKECLDKEPGLTEYSHNHPARCIHPLL